MNTKQVIAAAAIALVGSAAFAQSEVELQNFGVSQVSTVTRAEVRTELQRAQAGGEVNVPNEVLVAATPATKAPALFARADRAQVRSEVIKARAELAIPTEVALGAAQPQAAARSRAEVRAEARAYVRSDAPRANVSAGY
ncbi:MAG: DUF4148 domain-containing protein [Rhizobacter sp.]